MSHYSYSFPRRLIMDATGTKSDANIRPAIAPDILPRVPGLTLNAAADEENEQPVEAKFWSERAPSWHDLNSEKTDDNSAITRMTNNKLYREKVKGSRNSAAESKITNAAALNENNNAEDGPNGSPKTNFKKKQPATNPDTNTERSYNQPISAPSSVLSNTDNENILPAQPDAPQLNTRDIRPASGSNLTKEREIADQLASLEIEIRSEIAKSEKREVDLERKIPLISGGKKSPASLYKRVVQEHDIAPEHKSVYKRNQSVPLASTAAPAITDAFATTNDKISTAISSRSEPTVTINIGRIEVRVVESMRKQYSRIVNHTNPPRGRRLLQQQSAPISLEKYLKERAGTRL